MRPHKRSFWIYLICIGICEGVGLIAGLATARNIADWYPSLIKPSFNPPNWLFMPVWTILYALMGIAWAQVWNKTRQFTPHGLFLAQLILNGAWSFVFFQFHLIGLSVLVIIGLWLLILMTSLAFFKISKLSAWLLLPYWLWVSFASVLNIAIWRLNH